MHSTAVRQREIHMETGPIAGTLLSYTAPVLLSMLLQQCYNMADCMVVGRFCGELGLASTGIAGLVVSVIINFFFFFSTGISVITSRQFGGYRYDALKRTIVTVIRMGLLVGAVMMAVIWIFAGHILKGLSCPEEIYAGTLVYLRICCLGILPHLIYNIGNSVLRSLGDTKSSLYYLLLSCGLNLGLDIVLVVFFHLSLPGAAAATVISQWLLLLVIIARLMRMDAGYALSFKEKSLPAKGILEVLRLSVPSGFQAVFMSISSLVLQVIINSFGPYEVAGMTVFSKVEGFSYYPAFAYGIALTGFAGQNAGAHRLDRVRKSVQISLILSAAVMIPASLFLTGFGKTFLRLFTDHPETLRNGYQAICWVFPVYVLYSVNQVFLGVIKGLGKTLYPMVCTLCCYCIFRVVWCLVWIRTVRSMIVVYTSYDVSWVIMLVMLVVMYKKLTVKRRKI